MASQPANTAICEVNWGETVTVETPILGVTDELLLELIADAHKVGIDAPLGWPSEFVRAVSAYSAGGPWLDSLDEVALVQRATDRYVLQEVNRRPLSVSADRIAYPAMRTARLLTKLHEPVDRSGAGRIVEVYPAASIKRWGDDPDGYKAWTAGRCAQHWLIASSRRRPG